MTHEFKQRNVDSGQGKKVKSSLLLCPNMKACAVKLYLSNIQIDNFVLRYQDIEFAFLYYYTNLAD
jgi:hypothetical protein